MLGALLSSDDPAVRQQLELFELDISQYGVRYEDDLYERGIAPEELAELSHGHAVVLIDALIQAGAVEYAGPSSDIGLTLNALDQLSDGELQNLDGFSELLSQYPPESALGLGEVIDGPAEQRTELRELIRDAGFELEAIDEDSDSYPLVLIQLDRLDEARRLAESVGIEFYLARLYPTE